MKTLRVLAVSVMISLLIQACGGSDGSGPGIGGGDPTALEERIRQQLNTVQTDTDFTLMVVADNGHTFTHSIGSSTPSTTYRSASTSKWVTAVVILDLVDVGLLSLQDHPQDFIDFWPDSGNLAAITLRDLLSFTSGLNNEPLCINRPLVSLESCVADIAAENGGAPAPGQQFYYNAAHMQVAGLMAMEASGAESWGQVFAAFQAATGLFPNGVYDLPSQQNPRLAGGMHWRAEEYLELLAAIYRRTVLTPELIATMATDHTGTAEIVQSPAPSGLPWRYGLGQWIECEASDPCPEQRFSSPGAYGAYPFIDRQHGYFGLLAREGALGSFSEGYAVFKEVEDLLEEWAALNQ